MTMPRLLQRAFLFPFLLPVFFVLHIARYFYGSVPPVSALQMVCAYLLLSACMYLLLSRTLRSGFVAAIATFLLMGLFLYWGKASHYTSRLLGLSPDIGRFPYLLFAYLLIIALLCWLLLKRKAAAPPKLVFYLNTLFLLFIALEMGFMAVYALRNDPPVMAMSNEEGAPDRQARGSHTIYLLLFDEYASSASLREDWGFDNSSIDTFLAGRGFFINKNSRSNYNMTLFSMASLLHMDYFTGFGGSRNMAGLRENQACIRAIGNARVPRILAAAGYSLKNYSLFDMAGQQGQEVNDFILDKTKLITVNTMSNLFLRDYLPYLRQRSGLRRDSAYRDPSFYRIDDYNNETAGGVLQAARQGGAPQFVYAHFMMPHAPFFYDGNDRLMPAGRIKAISGSEAPAYYGYNVRHANNKLRQMVDTILRYDRSAVIIVLGDHGCRLRQEEGPHPEHFRNMSAVYFPDHDYSSIPDSLTNVNMFRIVMNKACGARYPLLPNHCYSISETQ